MWKNSNGVERLDKSVPNRNDEHKIMVNIKRQRSWQLTRYDSNENGPDVAHTMHKSTLTPGKHNITTITVNDSLLKLPPTTTTTTEIINAMAKISRKLDDITSIATKNDDLVKANEDSLSIHSDDQRPQSVSNDSCLLKQRQATVSNSSRKEQSTIVEVRLSYPSATTLVLLGNRSADGIAEPSPEHKEITPTSDLEKGFSFKCNSSLYRCVSQSLL